MIQHVPIGQFAARVLCAGTCLAILVASPRMLGGTLAMTHPAEASVTAGCDSVACDTRTTGAAGPRRSTTPATAHLADRLGIHPIGLSGDGQPHDTAVGPASAAALRTR